jgi:hypothetical protein
LYTKENLYGYVEDLNCFGPEGNMRLQGQTCPQSAILAARATGGNKVKSPQQPAK